MGDLHTTLSEAAIACNRLNAAVSTKWYGRHDVIAVAILDENHFKMGEENAEHMHIVVKIALALYKCFNSN